MSDVEAGSVTYRFKADTRNFQVGIKEINDNLKQAGAQATTASSQISRGLNEATGALNSNSSGVKLNRNQWQELTAAARHSFDALASGASPLRVLAIEGSKLTAVFSSGTGGVAGTLSALAGAINPVVAAIGALVIVAGTAIVVGKQWADQYNELSHTAKTTGLAIADLARMQQIAATGFQNFDISKGMGEFAARLREAQVVGGDLEVLLRKNGIAVNDAAGKARPLKDVFVDIAQLTTRANNEIDKMKFAEKVGLGADSVEFMQKYVDAIKSSNDQLTVAEQKILDYKRKAAEFDKAWKETWDSFKRSVTTAAVDFAEAFISMYNTFTTFDNEFSANVYATFKGTFDAVVEVWSQLPAIFEGIGKNAVNGLIQMTQDGLNSIIGAFNTVLSAVGANTIEMLDLSSSKLKLSEDAMNAGKNIGQAFTKGFDTTREDFRKKLKDQLIKPLSSYDEKTDPTKTDGNTQLQGIYTPPKVPKEHKPHITKEHVDLVKQYVDSLKEATTQARLEVENFSKSNTERQIAINLEKLNVIAKKEGRTATEAEKEAVIAQTKEYMKQKEILERLNEQKQMMKAVGDAFTSALDQWIVKGNDFKSVLAGLISQLSSMALQSSLSKLFGGGSSGSGGILGSLSSIFGSLFGGARASGGPVAGGKTYLVGEKGPELFVPGTSGSIVANDNMKSVGGSTVITFNVSAQDAASFAKSEDQISAMLTRAVRRGTRNM